MPKENEKLTTRENAAELFAFLFNEMTREQKKSVPDEKIVKITKYMVENGYRFVFECWYLQQPPKEEVN